MLCFWPADFEVNGPKKTLLCFWSAEVNRLRKHFFDSGLDSKGEFTFFLFANWMSPN